MRMRTPKISYKQRPTKGAGIIGFEKPTTEVGSNYEGSYNGPGETQADQAVVLRNVQEQLASYGVPLPQSSKRKRKG